MTVISTKKMVKKRILIFIISTKIMLYNDDMPLVPLKDRCGVTDIGKTERASDSKSGEGQSICSLMI